MSKAFVSIAEFREIVPMGRSKAYELVASGEIATVRLGSRRLIPMAEVERFCSRLLEQLDTVAS